VVVYAMDEHAVTVSIVDPVALFKNIERPDMHDFAQSVRAQLQRVIDAL
jgi:hypothetical protein